MKIPGSQLEQEGIRDAARRMAVAARTAPKAKGKDNLEILLVTGNDIKPIIDEMLKWGNTHNASAFLRDAATLASTPALLLIGTKISPLDVKGCGICGFSDCAENRARGGICAFNTGDLGIAVGSAAGVAADCRIDTRILFTAGLAAVNCGLLGPEVRIAYAFPLTVTGKNPFFDRQK
ncbi:MAG: hypothetical protein JW904_09015 [Spirochaetales bacterium]|nr:hypothetical protein [Spirochaetales bacterium]